MDYLQFYIYQRIERLEQLKWWQFWRNPRQIEWFDWQPKIVPLEKEASELVNRLDQDEILILCGLIGNTGKDNIRNITYEFGPKPTSYIRTDGKRA